MIKRIRRDNLKKLCELNKLGIKDQEYFKLREELIIQYMPMAERIVLNLGITSIDKEDLTQLAYEALILLLDELIDYKNFSPYLHHKIEANVKAFKNDYEPVASPISEVDIYSNSDVEECVISELSMQYLINLINTILGELKCKKSVEIFKRYYDLNNPKKTYREVATELGISANWVKLADYSVRRQVRKFFHYYYYYAFRTFKDFEPYIECNEIENEHTYIKK